MLQESITLDPSAFINLIYCQRLRLEIDRNKVLSCWQHGPNVNMDSDHLSLHVSDTAVRIGACCLERAQHPIVNDDAKVAKLVVLQENLPPLQSLMYCVKMNWMAILVRVNLNHARRIVVWHVSAFQINILSGKSVCLLIIN